MWNLFRRRRRSTRSSQRTRTKKSGLVAEQLENRRLLAGDVQMSITVDGDLILNGDSAANEFVIERLFSGVMQVEGISTNIVYNGSSASSHSFMMTNPMGIDRDVTIDSGGGNDTVSFLGLDAGRDFQATLGTGDDQLIVENVDVEGDFTVLAGDGADSFDLKTSDITGETSIVGSGGGDTLYIDSLFLGDNFTFNGGDGNDTVDVYFIEEYGSTGPISVDFLGGVGDDDIEVTGSIVGSMMFDGGAGDDTIVNAEPETTGNVTIEGGAGVESVTVTDAMISGDLYIHVREGRVGVTDFITVNDSTVTGQTNARGSTGDQRVSMTGNTLDRLQVVTGGGDDRALMTNNTMGESDFKTGSGADVINLAGNTVNDELLIDAGGGIDNVSTAADDIFAHYVTITGGLNHNDVGSLGIHLNAGASITSLETLTFLPPTT